MPTTTSVSDFFIVSARKALGGIPARVRQYSDDGAFAQYVR
jgi:hypothetical protein